MYLFVDTETSTLPNKDGSIYPDHPLQARVMQLAMLLLNEEFTEVGVYSSLIKIPEFTDVNPEALRKHKITKEKARQYGVSSEYAVNVFLDFFRAAKVIVGYNISFDAQMLDIEHNILCGGNVDWSSKRLACIMKISTPLVKLPFANGINKWGQKYKWPKLHEAYSFFTHKSLDNAHDALSDIRATAEIARCIVNDNHVVL